MSIIVGGILFGHEFQIVGDTIVCIHCHKTHYKNADMRWPIDREICQENPENPKEVRCPVKS